VVSEDCSSGSSSCDSSGISSCNSSRRTTTVVLIGLCTECFLSVFGMSMHELGRYARYCSVLRHGSVCSVSLGMLYLVILIALSAI
jgi:hypothetical protein